VPLFYKGKINSPDEILKFLETDSFLGKQRIEGVVVKNYHRQFLIGGRPIPIMTGKYVSEAFKEVRRKNWNMENTGKGKFQVFKEGFKTEARWHKAIQHLKENGELEHSPKDIGKLLKEVQRDITIEEKENIKEFLWREFGNDILRYSVGGFPEWYKKYLLTGGTSSTS
jgi:hypothetical protein